MSPRSSVGMRQRMHPRVAATALLLPPLLLTGCGGDSGAESSSEPSVVASSYPFAYVAERVGGDRVALENLTSPGVEPHDIELAAKQVATVQDADLAIFETGFQPAVDDAVEQADLSGDARIDVAEVATQLESGAHDGDHEHEHSEEDGHDHNGPDPHVWLDPTTMVEITKATADALERIDPDNARFYRKNAQAFFTELTALDQAFRSGLSKCKHQTIVTSHEAFGYLAKRYGLEQVGIAGIEPGTEPSPEQLAAITDLVREDGITTIFTEELVSPEVAETVADETGAEVATLDPIEGLSDDTEDETYLSLMRQNLAALKEANGCS